MGIRPFAVVFFLAVAAVAGVQLQLESVSPPDYNHTETPDPGAVIETETPAPKPTDPGTALSAGRLIHQQVNEIREQKGRRPLEWNSQLAAVARYHSRDMAENGYFDHTSPSGETLADRYDKFGIQCSGGGNIFRLSGNYGTSPEQITAAAIDSWMDSPRHRENILRQRFTAEGIGVVRLGGAVYVTQNFC